MKIESTVLKRLGPVPFWRGREKCLAELDKVYRAATARASREIYGDAAQSGAGGERAVRG